MNKIYHDDCFNIFPKYQDKSFDLCLTDPPYSAAFIGTLYERLKQYQNKITLKKTKIKNIFNWGGIPGYWSDYFYKSNQEYEDFTEKWMTEIFRLLQHGSFLAMFGCQKLSNVYINIANKIGFNFLDILIWKYTPSFNKGYSLKRVTKKQEDNKFKSTFTNTYEPIFVFRKPPEKNLIENYSKYGTGFINTETIKSNIIEINKAGGKEKQDNPHYSIKPEKLIEILLKGFSPEKVIDPFTGSGTIPYVCKKLNINYVAIELEQIFYDFAIKRLV